MACLDTRFSNYLKFAMKTWVVIMSAMIIAMADKCNNKRIQQNQWKNVVERDSGNQKKGFDLFLDERCRKDDFIIEYTGRVTKKHGGNYSMKMNPIEFKGKREKESTRYILM